jgi:hypothetical protein
VSTGGDATGAGVLKMAAARGWRSLARAFTFRSVVAQFVEAGELFHFPQIRHPILD